MLRSDSRHVQDTVQLRCHTCDSRSASDGGILPSKTPAYLDCVLKTTLQVECYQKAVALDQYFAVAYFQQGVSNFLLEDFEEALANFNDSLLYLRGNTYIDYDQLGLKFKLYSCEVLFNRGLCYVYLQQKEAGMQDFSYAVKEKMVDDHDVIDEAIKDEAEVRLYPEKF
jgi:tetratricopeptide (TPR) repeat protein